MKTRSTPSILISVPAYFEKQYPVTDLDVRNGPLAIVSDLARSDSDYLAFLGVSLAVFGYENR